jgi:hypothetical protein
MRLGTKRAKDENEDLVWCDEANILWPVQLLSLLDEPIAVELYDAVRLQHVVFLDDLLCLCRETLAL